MDYCDDGAVLMFVPAHMQLRDEETASEAEAMERWLDDGGTAYHEVEYNVGIFVGDDGIDLFHALRHKERTHYL